MHKDSGGTSSRGCDKNRMNKEPIPVAHRVCAAIRLAGSQKAKDT